ncbi:hypothetical protein [Pseudomonas viridiflava]|uniref:hypothetical protein n=1 Tax=Pseudomonas viridiflava TaxID=33069 RepID=UPI000F0871F7|nr:hypothetical protein [Pseudomonas viridiflava]
MKKVEEVFGVSSEDIFSYVERAHVDDKFASALEAGHQIIVYGASKQGKTALVKKHLNYDENIVVSLSPKTTIRNIYQSILRKSGVTLQTSYTEGTGDTSKVKGKAFIEGAIALVLKGRAEIATEDESTYKVEDKYEEIELNLDLPDDVASLMVKFGTKKTVILENFHYLPESVQRDFAFDLRTFHDLKIRFVILGVWKEANRLIQFNGELQDRVAEVPVEPWHEDDFLRIVDKGAPELNVQFSRVLVQECIDNAFKSVGVFQELLKVTCLEAGITETQTANQFIDDMDVVARAIKQKSEDYSGRHLKNLEAIASGNTSVIDKSKPLPYFLNYYIVMHILDIGFAGINGGISKEALLHAIKQIHHRKDDLKGSQLTSVLKGLAEVQSGKGINPPVLAYDSNSRQLKVVDSTFYFFLKNADLALVKEEILYPLDGLDL